MQLKDVFDKYFDGDFSYEELKEYVNQNAEDSDEACEVMRVLDAAEEYFSKCRKRMSA